MTDVAKLVKQMHNLTEDDYWAVVGLITLAKREAARQALALFIKRKRAAQFDFERRILACIEPQEGV